MSDARKAAPAVARNREPILAVLRGWLPVSGLVLELASGSGEHALFFAGALPGLVFQPTDPDAAALASIDAWAEEGGLPNLRPALRLDATDTAWPVEAADAVLCFNMIHISPWAATLGLLQGAARLLPAGAPLCLYGPYRQATVPLAPSNAAFDADLKRRNPAWGLRDLEEVAAEAKAVGFGAAEVVAMPANNLCVRFVKRRQ